ncbi:MAG: 2-C-methyl-D-erythritol 2,4-cyclodiphosphate synthase [Deltaproteobacteria bacterium]|nr:2-C-methyl-D-erythritol 2,4-cyclodiphosphate synthase [Deltaproteobacteria bacterium]
MAGSGERLKASGSPHEPVKQLRPLAGVPMGCWPAAALALHPDVHEVVCAVPAGQIGLFAELLCPLSRKIKICPGGGHRSESVLMALERLDPSCDAVLVHDGARPFLSWQLIDRILEAVESFGPAIAADRVHDTLKAGTIYDDEEAPPEGRLCVEKTLSRVGVWRAQTPQGFPRGLLEEALASEETLENYTDEAGLLEARKIRVRLVQGDALNMKVTTLRDLEVAELIARSLKADKAARIFDVWGGRDAGGLAPGSEPGPPPGSGPGARPAHPRLRVGHGVDFHAFAADGRTLRLGCVVFPGERGLLGHSDADVVVHALIDAILGAAGLGDIGGLFPDADPRWKGASGSQLLEAAWNAAGKGFRLVNADLTVIGERPKVAPRRHAMAEAMAGVMGVHPRLFNVKGKTTEGMGFLGRGEGLGASAAVLLEELGEERS